ncbi:MAG TPA: SDR family oxidoreductase, partial [Acidimicrobiales bacterium]|nr:SDR family oxidoreductase [Acidimicrobiales bacterium]
MATAIITGASRGLGEALAVGLAREGWSLVIDARTPGDLSSAAERIGAASRAGALVRPVAGDVTDPRHRLELLKAAEELGGLDLLVNSAGTLGPSPLPELSAFPIEGLRETIEANVIAPL